MSAFEMTALTNVVLKTTGGGTPERDNPEFWNGGIPWASVKDFKDGVHRLETTQEQISEKGLKRSASHLIPRGTPIICTRMAVGRIATASMPVAINQDLRALHIRPDFNTDYVVCAVNSIREQIENLSIGSTVKGISIDQLLAFEIGAPPLPEQTKIAEILTTVDRAIEQTEALIAKQQRLKTGLMQDLLTRGIDARGNLRSESTHKFKDSPLGRIPVEWEVVTLDKIADVNRGKFTHRPRNDPAFYGGEYPFIQTGDVTSNVGRRLRTYSQTLNNRGTRASKCFPKDTIAITIAANIADTSILDIPMYFPDSVVGAIVFEPNDERFVELMIRRWKPILESLAPQSAQRNINLDTLRPLLIPTPTPDEQRRIGTFYEKMDSENERLEVSLQKLRALKTALMQDLLTGRIRVTALL
jgi:type I restriction enzyme, S subunit